MYVLSYSMRRCFAAGGAAGQSFLHLLISSVLRSLVGVHHSVPNDRPFYITIKKICAHNPVHDCAKNPAKKAHGGLKEH